VDIHHIFPEKWCKEQKIDRRVYDTVVNKTPLAYHTNRSIGGHAPSKYLHKLESGSVKSEGKQNDPPIAPDTLNAYLRSHCIPVEALRADDFFGFMTARQTLLMALVSKATGHAVSVGVSHAEEGEELSGPLAHDSGAEVETD
jgi:hypothetical protein